MKAFVVFCLIVCMVGGCTTMQPVTGNSADVHERIASGALLKQGDDVLVLTDDGRSHYFIVTSLTASTIEGQHESIAIDQITFIQKRKLEVGKTVLAVGLTVVAAAAVVAFAAYSVRAHRSSAARVPSHSARSAQPASPQLLLPSPAHDGQLQTCDGPSGESKDQQADEKSSHTSRCMT